MCRSGLIVRFCPPLRLHSCRVQAVRHSLRVAVVHGHGMGIGCVADLMAVRALTADDELADSAPVTDTGRSCATRRSDTPACGVDGCGIDEYLSVDNSNGARVAVVQRV
jgi:hypothetical protein